MAVNIEQNKEFLKYIHELSTDLLIDNIFNVEFISSNPNSYLLQYLKNATFGRDDKTDVLAYIKSRIAMFQLPNNSSEVLIDYLQGKWINIGVRKTDGVLQMSFFENENTKLKQIFSYWVKATTGYNIAFGLDNTNTKNYELFPNEYTLECKLYPIDRNFDSNVKYIYENIAPYEVNEVSLDLTKDLSVKMINVSFNYGNSY